MPTYPLFGSVIQVGAGQRLVVDHYDDEHQVQPVVRITENAIVPHTIPLATLQWKQINLLPRQHIGAVIMCVELHEIGQQLFDVSQEGLENHPFGGTQELHESIESAEEMMRKALFNAKSILHKYMDIKS